MKIVFLAGRDSIHTVRLVHAMAEKGHEVHLVTMHDAEEPPLLSNIRLHVLPFKPPLGYLLNVITLRRILKEVKPDVLNAHYVSGYGTLARFSGFHPAVLTAWGSDINLFPVQSVWKHRVIQKNLAFADIVTCVSRAMKNKIDAIQKTSKEVKVIPFGVDCDKFCPQNGEPSTILRIGTVKSFEPVYGIPILIDAFKLARDHGLEDTELVLVGGGSLEKDLREQVKELEVEDCVKFIGRVSHEEMPKWLNSFDIYASLSWSEGLPVSVLEASACGCPVLVTDVGGVREAVQDGRTGFIVTSGDSSTAADRLVELAANPGLRKDMGKLGREFVLEYFDWQETIKQTEDIYFELVNN